jgi:hypothetical protein
MDPPLPVDGVLGVRVETGGVGAGTVLSLGITVGRRVDAYAMLVEEPGWPVLTESDESPAAVVPGDSLPGR